jgi:hypothetical protein
MTETVKPTKIKYVWLEMITKDEKASSVISGLFGGIKEHEKETFILLLTEKDVVQLANLRFYNFMTIEVLEPDYKTTSFLEKTAADQDLAFEMVGKLFDELQAAGYVHLNDKNIIDTEKYVGAPTKYTDGNNASSSTTNTALNTQRTIGGGFNTYNNAYRTVPKPDPKPAAIERTNKKVPDKAALEAMEAIVKAIQEGADVEYKPFPEVDEEASTTAQQDYDDAYGYGGYMCG